MSEKIVQLNEEVIKGQLMLNKLKLQPGMTSSSTVVALEYPDNKVVNAYARGEHPGLVAGARFTGVKLAKRQQDTVVFYILKAYQVVGARKAT